MRSLVVAGAFAGAVLASLLAGAPAVARDDVRAEDRFLAFSGNVPACDDPRVLRRIANRFAFREAHFWQSPLTIEGFERVRDVALRPWGDAFIPRRFCTAVSQISDGRKRVVHYSVREALGPIGIGSDVQWCVVGLDRHLSFAPACRAALP
ncbi:hypothetical protein FHS82_002034 [Pseudochelatococcus lubricantis]|uniref:Uncharacterized protein n=1 Tax=Pseudochelatococcus lubricantis TaxID=1538102 RepID=A0ABX0UZ30_9HYPH|nr:hypothetical protein [Pseudochelatococcus lubricantis]NIJ58192.1 hypothetical protein [Pseudochelatococcus lubricantis]